MGGSVFLLISLLVLFDTVPGHSFAMADMAASARTLPEYTQMLIFLGLPLAHVEAPSPVSILLSGILLKMGSYGLIRVSGMLPEVIGQDA